MEAIIYKIVPEELWQDAEEAGVFEGAAIDLTDGFIHFSTASQAVRTAELYFKGVTGLLLVAVDTAALGVSVICFRIFMAPCRSRQSFGKSR
jgi:uncharacterized protein (DUF952 family)